jgi:hypothetical protein
MIHFIRFTSAVLLLVVSVSFVNSDIVQFNVVMDGTQEVPANASPGTGTAVVVFDDQTGAISITGNYTGLTSVVTMAHLHGYSPAGVNSGILFDLTHTGGTAGTLTGNSVIPAGNIANVLNGLTYINVHTVNFPGGEIRGQLVDPVPEPGVSLLFALGTCLLFGRRLRK